MPVGRLTDVATRATANYVGAALYPPVARESPVVFCFRGG